MLNTYLTPLLLGVSWLVLIGEVVAVDVILKMERVKKKNEKGHLLF